jgi:hypothetical protein
MGASFCNVRGNTADYYFSGSLRVINSLGVYVSDRNFSYFMFAMLTNTCFWPGIVLPDLGLP